jgi:hypothetical protein
VVINGVLSMLKLRFQGEAFGSNSFVISFIAIPYFMVQLTNSVGGFVWVPEKRKGGSTTSNSHTPPSQGNL